MLYGGRFLAAAATLCFAATGVSAADSYDLRLSTLAQPNSAAHKTALSFAEKVEKRTDGRIQIKVYPANQLGDWTEVHQQVMQGSVDMALQSLSTSYDKRLAIAWFPYLVRDYAQARKAYSQGGYVYDLVDDVIAEQGLKLLGVYGAGMGGAGFADPVPHPRDPDADQGMKIRIWPGGTTHKHLMQRFGYNTTPVPWAELYTALQTGVVDGQIGGTPELAVQNFKDVTEMWIQYNDHFEPLWIFMNKELFDGMSQADRKVIMQAGQEVTEARFDEVEKADQANLETLREAGAEVITFDDETLSEFVTIARQEVWPKIESEIGKKTMDRIRNELGMN